MCGRKRGNRERGLKECKSAGKIERDYGTEKQVVYEGEKDWNSVNESKKGK